MTQEAIDEIKKECRKKNPYSLFTGLSFGAACAAFLSPRVDTFLAVTLLADSFMLKKSDEYLYKRCVNEKLAESNRKLQR